MVKFDPSFFHWLASPDGFGIRFIRFNTTTAVPLEFDLTEEDVKNIKKIFETFAEVAMLVMKPPPHRTPSPPYSRSVSISSN